MIRSKLIFFDFFIMFLFVLDSVSFAQSEVLDIADDLIIRNKLDSEIYENKKLSISEEVPDTKYSKIKSHQNYKHSSIKQKTIYDINNYGSNSDNPYEVTDHNLEMNSNFISCFN